jgi:hypothetical protein
MVSAKFDQAPPGAGRSTGLQSQSSRPGRRAPALVAVAVAAAVAVALAAGAAAAAAAPPVVVADFLNNPRGLALGGRGALYIAEAGTSGATCEGGDCLGLTSSITRVFGRTKGQIVTGLPSIGRRDGAFSAGVHGVSVAPGGRLFAVTASAGERLPPRLQAARAGFGKLFRLGDDGRPRVAADIERYEFRRNPDGRTRISNPYAVLALPGRQLVVDAGGNSLVVVRRRRVRLVAVFPTNQGGAESVPTSIARGPDGAYYVGEFVGEPRRGRPRTGLARVWRVVPGRRPRVFARGFNAITGLAFDRDGNLYVSEFSRSVSQSPPGDVVKVAESGRRRRLGVGRLFFPGGLAVRGRKLYVANWSILPGLPATLKLFGGNRGQVMRFILPPKPKKPKKRRRRGAR